jgi:glucosyl-3-phosphoglycerate synthase
MKNLSDWLRERTFHHSQFWDIKKLIEMKEKRGLKISLCFPTLNEEKTIGKEVVLIKSELMDRYPLLDEIAVIDSGSTDKTLDIAKQFGAKTFTASEVLPEEGTMRGKGENLWKSIYLLEGDIIIFLDADISNIHPKFVYGILGPMLYNPDIKYVKAFYDRPLNFSPNESHKGKGQGGRTTEILIRPLFSQFFPELSGLIQPLSGEFAGYREIFEQIPFPIGYGVETSHLIDISQKWGLWSIAQTDLDQRIHRNQSTKSLGKMSFGILQTFWNRLKLYENMGPGAPEYFTMRQIEIMENRHQMMEFEIIEKERRPMIQIPAYQNKFGRKP